MGPKEKVETLVGSSVLVEKLLEWQGRQRPSKRMSWMRCVSPFFHLIPGHDAQSYAQIPGQYVHVWKPNVEDFVAPPESTVPFPLTVDNRTRTRPKKAEEWQPRLVVNLSVRLCAVRHNNCLDNFLRTLSISNLS